MYSMNGTPLNNPAMGWSLDTSSEPHTSVSDSFPSAQVAGQDGDLNLRGSTNSGSMSLVMRVWGEEGLERLRYQMRAGNLITKTSDPSIGLTYRRSSLAVATLIGPDVDPRGGLYKAAIMLEIPYVYWRSVAPITSATQTVTDTGGMAIRFSEFDDSSGPIRDGRFLIHGPIADTTPSFQVAGAHGTYFFYTGELTASEWLLFDIPSGRAFKLTSASWSIGGEEVTGLIENGPGPYIFELEPAGAAYSHHIEVKVYQQIIVGGQPATIAFRAQGSYDR